MLIYLVLDISKKIIANLLMELVDLVQFILWQRLKALPTHEKNSNLSWIWCWEIYSYNFCLFCPMLIINLHSELLDLLDVAPWISRPSLSVVRPQIRISIFISSAAMLGAVMNKGRNENFNKQIRNLIFISSMAPYVQI